MTYRNRNEPTPHRLDGACATADSTRPASPPKGPMSDSHEETWHVQKIEDKIGSVAITMAPSAGDDQHRITFDVPKEEAAQYAVGGTHLITIGPRLKFWWETEEVP